MANTEGKKRSGCRTVLIILLILVVAIVAIALIWFKANEDKILEAVTTPISAITVGEEAADFKVTTTDGQKVSLSDLLEGKDVAVVVLFATWCGPCEKEFPEMDKVYRKYQDKIGMIGLDIDVLDNDDAAREYAESHDLSFPVAFTKDLPESFKTSAYPTTVIIDRNGKIGCCRLGSIPDAATFEKMVTTFIGDDYQERQLGYYTFYSYNKDYIQDIEFTVTSESGTQTYTTGKTGTADVFTDKPEDLKIKVISVPDGYKIDGNGETTSGLISTYVKLPVSKEK